MGNRAFPMYYASFARLETSVSAKSASPWGGPMERWRIANIPDKLKLELQQIRLTRCCIGNSLEFKL